MASHDLTFGVFVPQGWKMELASIDDPRAKWAKALEVAKLAEELGFDSLWLYDHFHNVPVPAHEAMFECWTTMAALTQVTSRIKLGQMVGCAPYRNPALLAKITSNIDVISGGRLIWGIGAGWYDHEFRGYGYDFLPAADRIRVLRETVEIVKALWSEPDVSYQGRHFTLDGKRPQPLATPPRGASSGAAASSSPCGWWPATPTPISAAAPRGSTRPRCSSSTAARVRLRRSSNDLVRGVHPRPSRRSSTPGRASFWGEPAESWRAGNLVGTPEQVAEKIRAYVDLGCTGFYPWCSDYPDTETLRLFAAVAAELR
jgi:alkanesulfonate monooxygenase SsuD/methylene tetrahydromethanopterin reductase-like flavin-dependent oxidoreductase (luciferase family)